jgi:DNA helicase-2/ATP-dependent DNA helicase PcrA
LFVAGDDDQSIYSLRHANPIGIVQFQVTYPAATSHTLNECFRCAPAILHPATALIAHNPNRLAKQLQSLYANAAPSVQGTLHVWSFPSAQVESVAIAQSCQRLINGGMSGQEDQILILISNRRLQLGPITQALANLGIPFDPPGGQSIRDQEAIRAVYSILRIARDQAANAPDYVAYRALLAQLQGVGISTVMAIGDLCVADNQNYRALFYLAAVPHWLNGRSAAAINRIRSIVQQTAGWNLADTIGARTAEIEQFLSTAVFVGSAQSVAHVQEWKALVGTLPQDMTIEELLLFLSSDDDVDQRRILNAVITRLGQMDAAVAPPQKRIRILTMHGAKGLSGKVVFIPSVEQGIMPSFRAIQAVGLLNEQRRLFYVSMTRAKAACIISHAALHTGAEALQIQQSWQVRLTRSQFLNEMGAISVNCNIGLTAAETAQIVADVNNL